MFSIVKSIIACLVGISVGAFLSVGADYLLESNGLIPGDNLFVASWIIWSIIAYRVIFTILGCFVTAKLAPQHPMRHAVAVGLLGTAVATLGAYATHNMNVAPQWYAWTLAALTIPTGWIGGVLASRR